MGTVSNRITREGWIATSLGEAADYLNGRAFKSSDWESKGLPIIRIQNLNNPHAEYNYTTAEYEERYKVDTGDLLFAWSASLGAYIWKGGPAWLNQHIFRVDPKDNVEKGFLYYFLNSIAEELYARSHGSGMVHITKKKFYDIPLYVPPLTEQRRIVAKIEALFSELDKGAESLKTARAQLKTYRQSLLKAAFEGRLTEQWRQHCASDCRLTNVKGMLEELPPVPRPNRWNSRSKDIIYAHPCLSVGNPGTPLPEGWQWVALVDVARMESGHTPSRRHPEWWGGNIPWLGIADARQKHGKIIEETAQKTNEDGLTNSAARLLPTGTICVSRTASVGYVVEMGKPMATSQDFVNWTPTDAVASGWLRLVFGAHREYLMKFGKGTTHRTIYFPEWLSVHIGLPSVEEQKKIVEEVNAKVSEIDAIEQSIEKSLAQSETLRQSILKCAFEGKLVPQNPNDEPASVLLERIRQEQADEPKVGRRKRKAEASA